MSILHQIFVSDNSETAEILAATLGKNYLECMQDYFRQEFEKRCIGNNRNFIIESLNQVVYGQFETVNDIELKIGMMSVSENDISFMRDLGSNIFIEVFQNPIMYYQPKPNLYGQYSYTSIYPANTASNMEMNIIIKPPLADMGIRAWLSDLIRRQLDSFNSGIV